MNNLVNYHSLEGAYIDTGTSKSVAGSYQAIANCKLMFIPLVLNKGNLKTLQVCKFSNREPGKTQFRMPLEEASYLDTSLSIVDLHIPLQILDKHKLYVRNVDNQLICKDPEWSEQLVHIICHL